MRTNTFHVGPYVYLICFLVSGLTVSSGMAQIGRVGINTTSPLALLHVQDSSVLFVGPSTFPGPSGPPKSGAGVRMMWYADKGAFRAGRVTSTEWDAVNVGETSFAAGFNTRASQKYSTAIGSIAHADADNAVAIGRLVTASGPNSVAIGLESTAEGQNAVVIGLGNGAGGNASLAIGSGNTAGADNSTAIGFQNQAYGTASFSFGDENNAYGISSICGGAFSYTNADYSIALGQNLSADSYACTVMGYGNEAGGYTFDAWVDTDPLFIIGNGYAGQHNALTLLKNGKLGLGVTDPAALLDVNGDTKLGVNGTALQEIIKSTVTLDAGSIAAGSTSIETFAVSNAAVGSTVYVSPQSSLDAGVIIAYARVSSPGMVEMTMGNLTGSAIDPASMDYYVTIIR